MEQLMEIREKILSIYSQYEQYLSRVIRFVICLVCVMCINRDIGYQESLTGMLPAVLAALICALLSYGGAVVVLSVIVVIHLLALSLVAALVGGCLFLLLLLVYFRFAPEDSVLLVLYPPCASIGLGYALPVAGGLLYGPTSGFTVAVGVIVTRFLSFVKSGETTLAASGTDTDEIISTFQYLLDGIIDDRLMQVQVAAVIIGAAIVYVVRRRAIPYAWIIASAAGAVVQVMVLLIGAILFDTDLAILTTFLGAAAAVLVGAVLTFAVFNLDYTRTENTQFEDDEYYYYVRAVPKNAYARPKRTVKTINHSRSDMESAGRARGTSRRYYTDDEQEWHTGELNTGDVDDGLRGGYYAGEDGYGSGDGFDEAAGADGPYEDSGYGNDGYENSGYGNGGYEDGGYAGNDLRDGGYAGEDLRDGGYGNGGYAGEDPGDGGYTDEIYQPKRRNDDAYDGGYGDDVF